MARLTQAPMAPRRSVSNPDSATDLTRLLSRLQQNILQADAERERRLRTSEYERNKVGINLEYARTLLTKLEQDALNIKIHTRRQEIQSDLLRKREIFDQLAERLRELEELSVDEDDEDSDDEEDLLHGVVITPSESQDSRSPVTDVPREEQEAEPEEPHREEEDQDDHEDESTIMPESKRRETALLTKPVPKPSTAAPEPEGRSPVAASETTSAQNLRSRTSAASTPAAAWASGADHKDTAREQLFGGKAAATTALSTTATTEAILDHQRHEQDKLTESLLNMAQALKQSTQSFSTALEEDKDVLGAAGAGLDKSGQGLDAATRRMGALKRMAEGKGMWGRMWLYGYIAGLWMFALLLVFGLPKLRF